MSRFHSYINTANRILGEYQGGEPFASWIKRYFSSTKKHGSKDRKIISHLCYCYFRLGHAMREITIEERIIAAVYLCSTAPNDFLDAINPMLNETASLPVFQKIKEPGYALEGSDIFPWQNELSPLSNPVKFSMSHLVQPSLFLRARPGKAAGIEQKLFRMEIIFSREEDKFELPISLKIDEFIEVNKEAVIQDASSQRIADFLTIVNKSSEQLIRVWDCCAASGGKSILAYDVIENIDLTVSDIRASIINNLKKRFSEAGITKYESLVADISVQGSKLFTSAFDLVIADVPCTGSGTWGRTPEQLFYFNEKQIQGYADLQKKIVKNSINYLKPGGYLLYITCSVFRKENEDMIDFLSEFQMETVQFELLEGYESKADTMFAALLRKKA